MAMEPKVIYLGVPVVDNHTLTAQLLHTIAKTVVDDDVRVVIFDNGSDIPYPTKNELPWCKVIRSDTNRGFYRPITDLAAMATSADLVALCHNDLLLYEKGWDRRLRECFLRDSGLGMVGFCGSNQVDERGGRGGGTMVNFRGEKGALTEHTGTRLTDLAPALIFDSLFLAMRQTLVPFLKVDDTIALNHFSDRVWPLRAIESGWRVGVLGIECDHMGGQTVVGVGRIEEDSRKWCEAHHVPIPAGMQAGTAVYLESERRYLTEYRDQKHLIPAAMTGWKIRPLART